MDIQYIEYATQLFFEMCRNHPEICPYDYRWTMTNTLKDGREEEHFKCQLCDNKIVKIKEKVIERIIKEEKTT